MSLKDNIDKLELRINKIFTKTFNINNEKENIDLNIPIYKSKKREEIINKNILKKKILLFTGGGVKGIVYVGVLRALEKFNLIKNIHTYVGTSIGSLVITMYLLGYNSLEMEKFLLHFDLNSLKSMNFLIFLKEYGLDRGEKIEYLLKRLIVAKGYNENITLIELYKICGIKFIITTVNLNALNTCYLSYETNPDLKLLLAIRMSMSIPLYYTPVIYKDEYYIDGACMDNYPITLFENNLQETLGFYICSSSNGIINKFNNIEEYVFRVLCSLWEGNDYNCIRSYRKYTVSLMLNNISMLDFGLSSEKIKEIINYGFSETRNYIISK